MANITQNIINKLKSHEARLTECESLKGYTNSDDVRHIFDQKFNEKNSANYATQEDVEEAFQKYVSSEQNMVSQLSSNHSVFDERLNKLNEQLSNVLNKFDEVRGELNTVKGSHEKLKQDHDALNATYSALSVRHDELVAFIESKDE